MQSPEKKPVHLRLSPTVVKQVDHYAVDRDIYRAEAFEELIRKGLERVKRRGSGGEVTTL